MSKTKIKNRNKAHLNPSEKTKVLLFQEQTNLFNESRQIEKNKLIFEVTKQKRMKGILNKMTVIGKQLFKRGFFNPINNPINKSIN